MAVLAGAYAAGRTGIGPPLKHLGRETYWGHYAINATNSVVACKMRYGLGDTARLLHRVEEEDVVPGGLNLRHRQTPRPEWSNCAFSEMAVPVHLEKLTCHTVLIQISGAVCGSSRCEEVSGHLIANKI